MRAVTSPARVRTSCATRPATASRSRSRWTPGARSPSTTSPPTRPTSSSRQLPDHRPSDGSQHHADHPGHVLLPARPHRRRDPGPGSVRDRPGLGGGGRVHRRPAPAQRAVGDVGPAHVRHRRCGRRDARGERVPRRLPRPLHPGLGLRRQPGPADHRAELHRQPARHRARVPAGPPGGVRPAHPLLAPPLRHRSAARRALPARRRHAGEHRAKRGTGRLMTTAREPVPRGFAMPRPGPSAGGEGAGNGADPAGGADSAGGAGPAGGTGPAGAADPAGLEPLAPDDTVDLAAQEQALRISQLLGRLDAEFVGLAPVKDRVREIAALLLIDRLRGRYGLTSSRPSLHMCFTGSPGTGKTTVATHMGELLRELGYLRKGQLVSVTRDDLVGQYVGHTAPKTKEVLKRAMGGVLLIDEAYYLYRPENERDYGQESIEI